MEPTAELSINTSATALQMWQEILGPGVTVVAGTASYDGDNRSSGIWQNGDAVSGQLTPADSGVILSTGRVVDVTNSNGQQNQVSNRSTNTSGDNNDADFNAAAGRNTFDAAYLEADIIPDTDLLSIQFTFASEEYPEYAGTLYNDMFGVWVDGVFMNSAIFNDTGINSINTNANGTLYFDNTSDTYNTEMDGFTATLTLEIPVTAGVANSIKIGVADVTDSSFDTAVLLAGNSIQGQFLATDDTLTHLEGRTKTIDVLANDDAVGVAYVTHINGQEVIPGDSVTLSSGHVITLTPAGTLSVVPPASQSGLTGPESVNFSYTAADGAGLTDLAFVTVTAIPCFGKGTRISTASGPRAIESLRKGDMVHTRDHGLQPVRWIRSRTVEGKDRFAPIVFEAGALGDHDRLVLSPQHRVLVRNAKADLLFGEPEVLVAAKDLVNGDSIHVEERRKITYFHILFDRHQLVWSEGLLTESFLPGPYLMGLDREIRNEIVSLFPQVEEEAPTGIGISARMGLKSYEARALFL